MSTYPNQAAAGYEDFELVTCEKCDHRFEAERMNFIRHSKLDHGRVVAHYEILCDDCYAPEEEE